MARAPAPSPRRIAGAAGLSIVGFLDDTRGLPVRIRLAAQALAVLALVAFLPADLRVIPGKICPLAVERVLLAFASLWFINLFNFMDGIDWISCVEVMTVAGGIGGLWMAGIISGLVGPAALLLAGAMAGFGVWNRPRARIFLGDAGSLALGLLLAWLMIETAAQGAWAAALLFSLYYWADATLTLLLRLARRDKVWVAHREHFYQQATRPGRSSVPAALVRIGGLNATLVGLGFAAELSGSTAWRFCAVGLGCGLVTVLLWVLADRRTAR